MAEINPYRPPEHDAAPEPPPSLTSNVITTGARIAGGFLIANALVTLIEKVALPSAGGGAGSPGIAPIIDLLIGGSLVAGRGKYRIWALVRCALGAVVFGIISLTQSDYISFVMQLAVSGSLIALLVGRPGPARITVASVVFGLYIIVAMVGIYMLSTGGVAGGS